MEIVTVVEVGLESTFKTGSHVIITVARVSHDYENMTVTVIVEIVARLVLI